MQESVPHSAGSRRWLLGGLTVLILGVAVYLGYRWHFSRPGPPAPRPPLLAPCPVTLAPGIHLLGGLSPAAAYVVETSEGLVLVDTGLDPFARLVKEQMAELRLDWRRLRGLLLTHAHGDHSGGARHLRAATGAKVYAGQGDADVLRAGGPREAFFSTFNLPNPTLEPLTVDVELKGDEVLTIGDTRFRVLATPGHSPGSLCYLMERGDQRVLFAGDVILSLSGEEGSPSSARWPLGTYTAYLAPRYRGSATAFLSTFRRLRELPVPDLVLPGHPRNDPEPQSPVLSQKRWEDLLDTGIREMERLQGRFARDGASFLDGVPKKLLPDLYYLGEVKGVAVYGFFSSSKFFLVNAPGGAGLCEFLNARLRQLGLKPVSPTAVLLTSGDQETTAGLPELVNQHHLQVIAPADAREAIRKACPLGTEVLSAEDLPRAHGLPVQPIPLPGYGRAPMAYLVRWAGKSVLFSGRIPMRFSPAGTETFARDLHGARVDSLDYRASLWRLGELSPDLWLPAFPTDGQNANVSARDWKDILTENRQQLIEVLH
ncbi:MAG TPA: MBL fold metallo-hydrolase [Gemmataceae bacterium]|nr:MBL fold metallo-hydrolase [Gemmataceae bacterium]